MPKPFDRLRERLLAAGLAPRHVRRYLAELSEHLSDLVTAERAAGRSPGDAEAAALARLGDTEALATAMLARPELRAWNARLPWAAFGVGPVAILVAAYAAALAGLMGVIDGFPVGSSAHPIIPGWFGAMGDLVSCFDLYVAPLLIGWALAVLAARQRQPWPWPVVGLVLIAIAGGAAELAVILPAEPGGAGSLGVGFTLAPPFPDRLLTALRILANLSLTLVPYLAWRSLQRASDTGPGVASSA